ncbi:cleft lip and palate transmembrane protein 1-domain-containing protein [Blastocladiella britannica]|nr:cleft lip and palate transmembrane protein 1-domain-containing protein [Blastocladiella britannica]
MSEAAPAPSGSSSTTAPAPFWKGLLKGLAAAWVINQGLKYISIQPGGAGDNGAANATEAVVATTTAAVVEPEAAPDMFGAMAAAMAGPKYSSPLPHFNIWPLKARLDLAVFLSPTQNFTPYEDALNKPAYELVNFDFEDEWGDVQGRHSANISLPESVRAHNGSYYAHVYISKHGSPINPATEGYHSNLVIERHAPLVQYRPKRRVIKHKKLLAVGGDASGSAAENAQEEEEQVAEPSLVDVLSGKAAPREIVSYWSPNVTINLVHPPSHLVPDSLPPFVSKHIDWVPEFEKKNPEGEVVAHGLKPPVWVNDFWILEEDLVPIEPTMTQLPMTFDFSVIGYTKFNFMVSMEFSLKAQTSMLSAGTDMGASSMDEMKRMFRDTNPLYLALTITVSMLHSVFEFLAFKNDVASWKDRKNVKGISVKSMLLNFAIQVVIFLYLFDNATDTSLVILASNGIGLAIEAWKISKATSAAIDWNNRWFGIIPRFTLGDKKSYVNSKTKEFDDEAFRYLKWLMYPLLAAYFIYSLMYQEHKSWWSYFLNSAVGSIYAFGFLQSLPQLFLNYRMKSVAHMNGRVLTYKFLTTIVDDLFVFVIRMPTLQRLAAFRDDVVFIVFVIQRYLYQVDHTRVNEYGQGGAEKSDDDDEEDDDVVAAAAAAGDKPAPAKSIAEKKRD